MAARRSVAPPRALALSALWLAIPNVALQLATNYVDVAFAALLVGLAIAALVLGRDSGLRPIIGAQLALATLLGAPVWHRFPDFGRVLLPLSVLSLLALVPALAERKATARSSVSHEAVHPAT